MKRAALLLLLLALLAACTVEPFPASPAAPAAANVTLWGDSFGESVAPYLGYDERVMGGTAPSDFLPDVQKTVAAGRAPRTAVLLFVGNKIDSVDYEQTARDITSLLTAAGSRVIWVAAPPLYTGVHTLTNAALGRAGVTLTWHPANAVGPGFRAADGMHLSTVGAQRFAHAIKEAVE